MKGSNNVTLQAPHPPTFRLVLGRYTNLQAASMAFLPHSSPRIWPRRINARLIQRLFENPQRRKTSVSSDYDPKHTKPPKPADTKIVSEQATAAQTPDKLPLLQRLGPFTRAANAYDDIQKRRPWATQLGASLCVYFCGDMLAQYIDGEGYDPSRTLRHLTIGAGASIPGYTW